MLVQRSICQNFRAQTDEEDGAVICVANPPAQLNNVGDEMNVVTMHATNVYLHQNLPTQANNDNKWESVGRALSESLFVNSDTGAEQT